VQLFQGKVGDTAPAIRSTLLRADGTPADLSTALGVTFVMSLEGAAVPKVDAAADIIGDPSDGVVEYAWAAADVDTAAEYLNEWVVEWPPVDGVPQITRFPRPGYDRCHFEESL
jgi:hypothetical protein